METEEAVRGEEPCLPGAAAPAEQPIIATAVEDLDEAAAELYDEELFDADVQQAAASSDTPPGVFTAVMSRTAEEELEPAWGLGSAQELEEASVPAWGLGSTPARASLLSWRCVRQMPPVDPSETDPAADPAVAGETWSAGMLPLVVDQPQEMVLGQEMLRAGWLPSCLGDCVPALAVPVPPGCRGVGWPAPVRNSQPPVGGCPCRTAHTYLFSNL